MLCILSTCVWFHNPFVTCPTSATQHTLALNEWSTCWNLSTCLKAVCLLEHAQAHAFILMWFAELTWWTVSNSSVPKHLLSGELGHVDLQNLRERKKLQIYSNLLPRPGIYFRRMQDRRIFAESNLHKTLLQICKFQGCCSDDHGDTSWPRSLWKIIKMILHEFVNELRGWYFKKSNTQNLTFSAVLKTAATLCYQLLCNWGWTRMKTRSLFLFFRGVNHTY